VPQGLPSRLQKSVRGYAGCAGGVHGAASGGDLRLDERWERWQWGCS